MSLKTANHYILSTLLLLALTFNQGLGMLSSAASIVEVEAPLNTPDNLHEVSCVFAQLNDSPIDDKFTSLKTHATEFVNPTVLNSKLLFVATDYVNNFLARGPPVFL